MTQTANLQRPPFLLIMPSYNQSHYIAAAVDSVLQQDDPNWVLWIVDNSSDETPKVMSQYADARIHFVHIPQRMDPGTCINWVLEREGEHHRDFSYIHTDNLLRQDYVRLMREALSHDVRSVAYCDMNSLEADGSYSGVFRRGRFDLARLFSFSTLGVPFSSTTLLSRELGGFSRKDVADDVIFCMRAWPRARFVHIGDAIMDYRCHADSRTTAHGGTWAIERSFLQAFERLLPEMEAQDASPLPALASRLSKLQVDIRLALFDHDCRRGLQPHPSDGSRLSELVHQDLIDLCGLQPPEHTSSSSESKPHRLERLRGKIRKRYLKLQHKLRGSQAAPLIRPPDRRIVWEASTRFRNHVVPWVYLSARACHPDPQIKLADTDVYTLWGTLIVHRVCGWRFQLPAHLEADSKMWPHLDPVASCSKPACVEVSLKPDHMMVRAVMPPACEQ